MKVDIEEVSPNLTPLLPTSFTSYHLVKLPVCIPINYVVIQVCKGHIEECHCNAFESDAEGLSFWIYIHPGWSPVLQVAAMLDDPAMRRGSFP